LAVFYNYNFEIRDGKANGRRRKAKGERKGGGGGETGYRVQGAGCKESGKAKGRREKRSQLKAERKKGKAEGEKNAKPKAGLKLKPSDSCTIRVNCSRAKPLRISILRFEAEIICNNEFVEFGAVFPLLDGQGMFPGR
jgi:hypothetical protein